MQRIARHREELALERGLGGKSAGVRLRERAADVAHGVFAAGQKERRRAVLSVLESFAPGVRATVVDAQVLHPKKLETHFGVARGNLRHADDTLVFADRMPYVTPVAGLYSCSSACAPAGGVFGLAGYNAAVRVLADFELGLERTEVGPTQ